MPSELARFFDSASEEEIGEQIARLALGTLAADDSRAVSLMRAASTNTQAGAMPSEFVARTLIDPISSMITTPHTGERVALVAAQILGVLFSRPIVGVRELTAASTDDLVAAIGATVQRYLTEPAWPDAVR